MSGPRVNPGAQAERQQLRWLAAGLTLMAVVALATRGLRPLPIALIALATLALLGSAAGGSLGRSAFLLFTLAALALGRLVSWAVLIVLYALAIAALGSLFRVFGMNRLERDFAACRDKTTMFVDVPPLDPAGFRRQS